MFIIVFKKLSFTVIILSPEIQLNEPPRTADAEVAEAIIREPFSNAIEVLFHSTTPC